MAIYDDLNHKRRLLLNPVNLSEGLDIVAKFEIQKHYSRFPQLDSVNRIKIIFEIRHS